MANLCNNYIVFEGKQKAIREIHVLFQYMKEREDETGHGQLPEFLNKDNGYFFDIYWNEDDIDSYQYATRWAPNIEVVRQVAERYGLGFTLDYEEMGCLVYGRVIFSDGILTDIYLQNEDFDAYLWNEDEDTYYFEGKIYHSEWEILDILLDRKIQAGKQH